MTILAEMPRMRPRVRRDPLSALQHAQGGGLQRGLLGMHELVREQAGSGRVRRATFRRRAGEPEADEHSLLG